MLITALILSLTGIIVSFIYSPKTFGYMTVKDFNEVFDAEQKLRQGLIRDLRMANAKIDALKKPVIVERNRTDWVILPEKDTKKPAKKPAMRKSKK